MMLPYKSGMIETNIAQMPIPIQHWIFVYGTPSVSKSEKITGYQIEFIKRVKVKLYILEK